MEINFYLLLCAKQSKISNDSIFNGINITHAKLKYVQLNCTYFHGILFIPEPILNIEDIFYL